MKRKIKFRVWNGLKMEADINVMAGSLGVFYVQGMDETDSASLSTFNTKYPDGIVEMQFTGSTDKNNKDIYEGDIIGNKKRIGVVCWNEKNSRYWIETNDKLNDWFLLSSKYEVLGNIYENPELLTDN